MNIVEFLQANSANFSLGTSTNRIKYIVIHYVGATGGAMANLRYYHNDVVKASAHYYVDFNGDIYQSVQDKDIAWHCGSKSGYKHPECRNQNSIGIEMCVRNEGNKSNDSRDWYFEDATVIAAEKLTKELMEKYSVPIENVIRHYDVTGKICPNPYVYNHTQHKWDVFKAALVQTSKKSGWISTDAGWMYYLENSGEPVRNDWLQDPNSHKWYWFDAAGHMVTDTWYRYKDRWFYLQSDGSMVEGLKDINGKYYFFYEGGEMSTEPVTLTPQDDGALKYVKLASV